MDMNKRNSLLLEYDETEFIDYDEFFQLTCLLEDVKMFFTGKGNGCGDGE